MTMVETIPVQRATFDYGGVEVRAVILRETLGVLTAYVAQGLERDVAAQGSSPDQAMARLRVSAQFDHEMDHIRSQPLGPAPLHVFEWYRAALSEGDG